MISHIEKEFASGLTEFATQLSCAATRAGSLRLPQVPPTSKNPKEPREKRTPVEHLRRDERPERGQVAGSRVGKTSCKRLWALET